MSPARLASYLVFPVLEIAAVSGGLWAVRAGYPAAAVVFAVWLISALVVTGLERVLPFRADWTNSRSDLACDVPHLLVSGTLLPPVFEGLIMAATVPAVVWLSGALGGSVWPNHWPLAVQVVFALVVVEFCHYWSHRLSHRVPLLWRLHSVHHSSEHLYWVNASRVHPLDLLVQLTPAVIVLALLGCTEQVAIVVALFTGVFELMQHSNVQLRLGPLNWIFAQSEIHRWHHSVVHKEQCSNFGETLILWDLVFGTRYLPSNVPAPDRLGVDDVQVPQTYLGQLVVPLSWNKLVRRDQ